MKRTLAVAVMFALVMTQLVDHVRRALECTA